MLTEKEFKELILKSESSILDFKEDLYDFENGNKSLTTSKFVKDVISFCNTIRNETSYIIFGIKEKNDGTVEQVGIQKNIDDSILQEKVKDKLTPRPFFSYYTIKSNDLLFGILEFPIYKYEMPITPIGNKLIGLDIGKVYYRNGSSNTEAKLLDTFRINDWLKSLPEQFNNNSLNNDISEIIIKLTEGKIKLSVVFSELLNISKKNNLISLNQFCKRQIQGVTPESEVELDRKYRSQMVFISIQKFEINPYSYNLTTDKLKKELEANSEFNKFNLYLHQPIIELESYIEQIEKNPKSFLITMKTNTQDTLDLDFRKDLYLYLFPENIVNTYRNIRQKTIEILMEI